MKEQEQSGMPEQAEKMPMRKFKFNARIPVEDRAYILKHGHTLTRGFCKILEDHKFYAQASKILEEKIGERDESIQGYRASVAEKDQLIKEYKETDLVRIDHANTLSIGISKRDDTISHLEESLIERRKLIRGLAIYAIITTFVSFSFFLDYSFRNGWIG